MSHLNVTREMTDNESRLGRFFNLLSSFRSPRKAPSTSSLTDSNKPTDARTDALELTDRKCDVYTIGDDVNTDRGSSEEDTRSGPGSKNGDVPQSSDVKGAEEQTKPDVINDVTQDTGGNSSQSDKQNTGLVVRFSDEVRTKSTSFQTLIS